MNRRYLSPVVLAFCFSAQPIAWTQAYADDGSLTSPPKSINRLYSDIDMRLSLAMKKNSTACVAEACEANRAFDERVQQLGQNLATVAYDLYPNLEQRVPYFQFNVVDKEAIGTASNAEGDIVVFRGLQHQVLNDEALSFLIAREMGHVIGRHHTKNTSTKLIISAVASFVFPVAGIIAASSTAAQASTVSSVVTSVASSATSFVGSKVAMTKVKPKQLAESDAIANSMLESQDADYRLVFNGLPVFEDESTGWLQDLKKSRAKLQARLKFQSDIRTLAMSTH
jgi:Zn-dependent protease with chaperone function